MNASPLIALCTAQARFEAARRLAHRPTNDRTYRRHGHSFIASVQGNLLPDSVPFEGAQCHGLTAHLQRCVEPLDYCDLNVVMDHPDDLSLARWVLGRLSMQNVHEVSLQSTADQGVQISDATRTHIWRRYHFRAAHQLPNVAPGHKCGRMHGHGFQVVLHVESDGDLIYDDLDAAWAPFHDQLHHHCLNDIEGLSNPTSEMLSAWLWHRLKPTLTGLNGVTVYETGSCGAQFDGERYAIWKDFTIDSAIRMSKAPHEDPRHFLHGDTFLVRLHLVADLDRVQGWTVDFGDVKTAFNPVFKALDHHPLYERAALSTGDPESIARWTFSQAREALPELRQVDVIDSQGSGSMVYDDKPCKQLPI